jgi:radical SAM superfamily enzyme YgiQ (UPF0313 family)
MYRSKPYKVRPFKDVEEDIKVGAATYPGIRRVFLADGDAMVQKTYSLTRVLDCLNEHMADLERVGIYSDAHGINRKTPEELGELVTRKLGIMYLGLESGSDTVLRRINKHCTAAEMTAAVHKAKAAGMQTSVIALLGIGGRELSEEHAAETAAVVSRMAPDYFSALTLTIVDGTPLAAERDRGTFVPLSPRESLAELRRMIELANPPSPVVFRTNHASNYVPLRGALPADRGKLIAKIDAALATGNLKPEWLRGL